jgi:hypothetical protein
MVPQIKSMSKMARVLSFIAGILANANPDSTIRNSKNMVLGLSRVTATKAVEISIRIFALGSIL